jgi:hypothetical protein
MNCERNKETKFETEKGKMIWIPLQPGIEEHNHKSAKCKQMNKTSCRKSNKININDLKTITKWNTIIVFKCVL